MKKVTSCGHVYNTPPDNYVSRCKTNVLLQEHQARYMEKNLYETFDTIRFSDLVLEDKEANDLEKKVVEAPTQDKELNQEKDLNYDKALSQDEALSQDKDLNQDKDSNTSSTTRNRVNNFCNEDNTPTRDKESKTPTQDKELHVTKVRSPEEVSYWINFGHFPDK